MLSAKRSTGVALKSESEEFILCKWVDQWSPTKEQMPPKMLINSMCQWIHPVISNPFSITDVLIRSLLPIDFARFPKSGELMCSVSCHLRFTCKSFDTCTFAVCSCDLTGALLDTPCDRVSGQCTCKEGIEGRKCDKCKQFYVNFGPSGCTSEYALLVQHIFADGFETCNANRVRLRLHVLSTSLFVAWTFELFDSNIGMHWTHF